MQAEAFIARRLGFQGRMVTLSVAVSFLVIVIAVAVSSGFRHHIRDGVAFRVGDVTVAGAVQPFTEEPAAFFPDAAWLSRLGDLPGVEALQAVVSTGAIVKNGTDIHAVRVKGIPMPEDTSAFPVRIPRPLADLLGLSVGDEMQTWFIGYAPEREDKARIAVRKFHVSEIFTEDVRLQEDMTVYARMEDIRRVARLEEGAVTSLEIRLRSPLRGRKAGEETAERVWALLNADDAPEGVVAQTAQENYPALFDWLDLLDFNVLVLLVLMIIVSGFNMISGLLIMLFRHIPEIGTLKALGMTDRALMGVFFRVSARKVAWGMLWGNLLALAFCWVEYQTHLIPLNPDNYFISYVPVSLDIPYLLVAELLASLAILLLVTLPVLFVSRVDPADTMRAA